ncbi:class I SAM-dependent DNA methyltransferase [Arthrobacter sp. zg-Y859]|uniref:site-specific DNA-methyltransferase (adenine-specific) n=1 Tax=Arthrobacter jinronghuae TaxID=2964609 RepID=A0ABT1NSW3_9MICC|nr:DNA methyltransferase [Arthrobacter jinronghuae]MCQ1950815.1 class I SAM-dependent DNA methyltransferase [Arthrobacter jinronghuae]UWX79283.1 class I SAM-dependent DNA methyltransferase [Arthrobacter jinronghuae]
MPSFDSIVVGEDWISEHFFTTDSTKESYQAEVIKLRKSWDEQAKDGDSTTLTRFAEARGRLQVLLAGLAEDPAGAAEAYSVLRHALGFQGTTATVTFNRSGTETMVSGVWATGDLDVLFLEATPADAAEDVLSSVRPLGRVLVDGKETDLTAAKLVSEMYLAERAPRFVVIMAGRWTVLTEPERWAEGRYLAADALLVADRNDTKKYGETDRFLSIFGRDSLMPAPDGSVWWDTVLESSVKHTVGVSQDLREGIRRSIEIIANDVLQRRAARGLHEDDVDGQVLAKQSLRFLYRILFLLYAEASPEMGVLPVGAGEYSEGYGLDRLRELTLVNMQSRETQRGTHIYESLELLFRLVDGGHDPARGMSRDEVERASGDNEGLVFQPLKADLFQSQATSFINEVGLSNSELQRVLRNLLLSKESRGKDRGFISYAELGINQLGAVYEGLMSYTGFIAAEPLYEVAKDGNPEKGSWVVPVDRADSIDPRHFVKSEDELTGEKKPVRHEKGSFVFRLAGRERQQSASFYTPEVLTKFVVSQALEELLDQDGETTSADEILNLTVCEPALGSGAFAIEAVRQLADEYLKRKQAELDTQIPADEYQQELQRVKAQIALHQVHGVDLNSTAVELAEVSLWLDTMVQGLQAPWFGLRLKRGNSLIGSRRATYSRAAITDKSWLKSEPAEAPLTGLVGAMANDSDDPQVVSRVHHFLLPADGWGTAAEAKEVKDLAGDAQKELKVWRSRIKAKPTKTQIDRLVALSGRVESLWKLALRRLQVAESEARRDIDYFGKEEASVDGADRHPREAVTREQIEASLSDPDGSYQRLRRVMDAWNAIWFWPLTEGATGGSQPPTLEQWISALEGILGQTSKEKMPSKYGRVEGQTSVLSMASWGELEGIESFDHSTAQVRKIEAVLEEHPWLQVCENVAKEQGFFHWELDFASVFGRGGFDLQVGNPPWVRPRSDEAALLAEGDPWWQLAEKPTQAQVTAKRLETLAQPGMQDSFINAAVPTPVVAAFLGSPADYALLAGLQPDLYRAFMVRTWRSVSKKGAIALVHPESHFTEKKAAYLRAETYRRLRRHWQFINELSLFEIHHLVTYGVHVYGSPKEWPEFRMAASLYHPDTVARSEVHDGSGEVPGLKDSEGNWDTRPHLERIIRVDESILKVWADILDEPGTPPLHARMVYPVNRASSRVLEKLSKAPRVRELGLQYSRGWDESIDRKKGYFDVGSAVPDSWDDVILQGPHFTVANPFAKQPNPTMKNNLDWTEVDLEALPENFIPRTSYQITANRRSYDRDYGDYLTANEQPEPVRNRYRIGWRMMASTTGIRTLFPALIPPGAAHTDGTHSAVVEETELALLLGLWASIPVDFLVKVSQVANLRGVFISGLPRIEDPLLKRLISERGLKLNCLTQVHSGLWTRVSGMPWTMETSPRIALERRMTLIELDALSAIGLGISSDELCTIYRTQFPVLRGYEQNDLYDANGRKVPGGMNRLYHKVGEKLTLEERTWTHPQSGVEYVFEFPFRSFDREEDMRKAYAHFENLLGDKS